MSAIDDDADFGPYRFGTDNAYHTGEREAEKQALVAVAERFGLRINVALAALAQPARGPSERARARLDFLERENAVLRREAFAAETHRERELIDLQVEIRRLQRQGHDVATLARSLRARGRVEEAAAPSPPPASLKPRVPPEVARRYAKAEAERLEQERVAKDMVARLEQRMRDRERFGGSAFEGDDRL